MSAAMQVHRTVEEWRTARAGVAPDATVGFVPTMGALHAGHRSLLERARAECDVVVLSIFVNPTQFDDAGDLAAYPATLDDDLAVAERAGCDHVMLPTAAQMYPDGYRYRVSEQPFSAELCGAHRPGHFDGVLTVVLKLLVLAAADRAYFGEKDLQQLLLVRDMAAAFFLPTEIVACPTVRETDGLAMSSRNRRLSSHGRATATGLPRILSSAPSAATAKRRLGDAGFEVDYVEDRDVSAQLPGGGTRRLAAVTLDGVRLIDNVDV